MCVHGSTGCVLSALIIWVEALTIPRAREWGEREKGEGGGKGKRKGRGREKIAEEGRDGKGEERVEERGEWKREGSGRGRGGRGRDYLMVHTSVMHCSHSTNLLLGP